MRAHSLGLALALAGLAPVALSAQDAVPRRDERRNALSVQPAAVLFDVYAGEYERWLGAGMSLGVGASWYASGQPSLIWESDHSSEERALSLDVKWRYYLSDSAFSGVALVAQAGNYGERVYDWQRDKEAWEWRRAPTLGFGLEYTSRAASPQGAFVTLGLGGKKILGGDYGPRLDLSAFTVRFAVGGLF